MAQTQTATIGIENNLRNVNANEVRRRPDTQSIDDLYYSENIVFDKRDNDISSLAEFGINKLTPEIISSQSIKNLYSYISGENTPVENSNYDFMIFQTQLDLTIKEIINSKIEENEDLKEEIFNNLKLEVENIIKERDEIKAMILNINSTLDVLDIEKYLKVSFTNVPVERSQQEQSSETSIFNVQQSQIDIASIPESISNALDYGWKEDSSITTIAKLADLKLYGEDSSDAFRENTFYDNICDFTTRAFFGIPHFRTFDKDTPVSRYDTTTSEERSLSVDPSADKYDTSHALPGIALLSRAQFYNDTVNRTAFGRLKEVSNLNSSLNSNTYGSILAYAKESIGTVDSKSFGDSKLIDMSNIKTSDVESIEVFNRETKEGKSTSGNRFTGDTYFKNDIIKSVLAGDGSTLFNELFVNINEKSKNVKEALASIISNSSLSTNNLYVQQAINKNSVIDNIPQFTGILSDIATIIYEELNLSSFFTSNSSISSIDGISTLSYISTLKALSEIGQDEDSYLEFGEWPASTDDTSVYLRAKDDSGNNVYLKIYTSDPAVIGLHETFSDQTRNTFTRDQYSLDSYEGSTLITLNNYPHQLDISGNLLEATFRWIDDVGYELLNISGGAIYKKLEDIVQRIHEIIIRQTYLTGRFIYKALNSIIRLVCNAFRYKFTATTHNSGQGVVLHFNDDFLKSLHLIKILKDRTLFSDNISSETIIGVSSIPIEDNSFISSMRETYRTIMRPVLISYFAISSLKNYSASLTRSSNSISSNISGNIIENIGFPSVERLMNLEYTANRLLTPSTSFSDNISYFSSHNTRNSKDLSAVSSLSSMNPGDFTSEDRVLTIGIPNGLLSRLRSDAGYDNDRCIIQIMFYVIDHKKNTHDSRNLGCILPFMFNSCLKVDTLDKDANIDEILELDSADYRNLLSIDNESSISRTLSSSDLFTYSYGRFSNNEFLIKKTSSRSEAANDMKRYKASLTTDECKSIINNHIVDYTLKQHVNIFGGVNLETFNFPTIKNNSLLFGTDNLLIDGPGRVNNIISEIIDNEMSDDLKDYISRTTAYSSIINPELYINKSLSYSKFDNVFMIPVHRTNVGYFTDEFKTFIPIVSIV